MRQKMRGFIDPYSLGFVIMIVSGLYFQAQPTRLERLSQQPPSTTAEVIKPINTQQMDSNEIK